MADKPATSRSGSSGNEPLLSVIIPARNEELSIGSCLESLVAQAKPNGPLNAGAAEEAILTTPEGLTYEIIVVDDASSDRTASIAQSFFPTRVIAADPLPAGWTGKSNACATGARIARGAWLLFTDADTTHKPGSLSSSLEEAHSHEVAVLSFSPEQEVSGIVQRAVMPLIFAELACTYKPAQVSDPASPVAAANGQFLLLTRQAYQAVGGHASVAEDLLEDVALARRLKRSGHKIRFRFGGDIVRTRMYRSVAQMREGWTKNLALLFPSVTGLAVARAAEFVSIFGAASVAGLAFASGRLAVATAAACVSIAIIAKVFLRVRRAHFGTISIILAPLGLPFFSYLLLRSRISHKKGIVRWKGRRYKGSGTLAEPATHSSGASHG